MNLKNYFDQLAKDLYGLERVRDIGMANITQQVNTKKAKKVSVLEESMSGKQNLCRIQCLAMQNFN